MSRQPGRDFQQAVANVNGADAAAAAAPAAERPPPAEEVREDGDESVSLLESPSRPARNPELMEQPPARPARENEPMGESPVSQADRQR